MKNISQCNEHIYRRIIEAQFHLAISSGVEKQLVNKALTKGTIYPIVKSISKWFGVKMTKEVFAGFFKKAIPVVGGVVGGGLTYATFKPCCVKLKEYKNIKLDNNVQSSVSSIIWNGTFLLTNLKTSDIMNSQS